MEEGSPDYPETLQRAAGHARKAHAAEGQSVRKNADHTWKSPGGDGCTTPDR